MSKMPTEWIIRRAHRRWLTKLLAFTAVLSAAFTPTAHSASAATSCGNTANFGLGVAETAQRGHLMRGPTTLSYQPLFTGNSYGGGYTYPTHLYVDSRTDARCAVSLQYLSLPAGVTAQMPTAATLSTIGRAIIPLKLAASSNAPVGNFTMTIRATIGTQTRTYDAYLAVQAQPDVAVYPVDHYEGYTSIAGLLMVNTVSTSTNVQLSSSNPTLLPVPNYLTVPAGGSSALIQITPGCLPGNTPHTATITATHAGASHTFPITVNPSGLCP